jgi:hypothetical protein
MPGWIRRENGRGGMKGKKRKGEKRRPKNKKEKKKKKKKWKNKRRAIQTFYNSIQ